MPSFVRPRLFIGAAVVALGALQAGCAAKLASGEDQGPGTGALDGAPATDGRTGDATPVGDGGPPSADAWAGDGTPPPPRRDSGVKPATDGGKPAADSSLPRADSTSGRRDFGASYVKCKDVVLTGSTERQKYDNYFTAHGRPKTDQDMGWTHDPKMLDLINTVRFGNPPASVTGDIEKLRTACDFVPEHHNQTSQTNYDLFKTLGLTDSSDAWAKFNSRDFIPGSLTRYGYDGFANRFVNWSSNDWTKLALARCPDCADGIVTLSGVPAEQVQKQHDFFRVMEVRFVTDRAVYAATPADRQKHGDGRLFVSKPFKVLAAIDSSGSLYTHITTLARTFFVAPQDQVRLRYRGEIADPLYNVIQSGDAAVKSTYRTGMVAVLIRYSEVNDKPSSQVCDRYPVPAGTDMTPFCRLEEWGTWRCGPFGPNAREADQICRKDATALTGFKWATNNFVSCATCKIDPLRGCTYGK
ncbi:MAG: hypothetical protein IT371_14495 [Deltaproteobacteria bacterium]|nr:hypothetical protein [Deltaproteobacteria bacterium]